MSMDLRDRLDTAFDDGPAHPPIEDRLVDGRRALRRRRATTTAATASVVAVLALSPMAVSALHGSPERIPVAAPGPATVHLPLAPAGRVDGATPPILLAHGHLFRRDAGVVVERLHRMRVEHQPAAAAVVAIDGMRSWVFVAGDAPTGLSAISAPHPGGASFAAWTGRQRDNRPATTRGIVPGHTHVGDPIPREDSPVEFTGDRLTAKPGATVTARIDDPVTSGNAIPAACTARAAAVTQGADQFFVLGYTCPDGTWDLFTEPAGQRADTLDVWLTAVKTAQDGSEGIR